MIDCVILSYARTRDLYRMTQTAINSLVGDFDVNAEMTLNSHLSKLIFLSYGWNFLLWEVIS